MFGSILIDDKEAIASLKNVDNQGKDTQKGFGDIVKKAAGIGIAVIAGTSAAVGGLMAMASSTSDNAAKWLELSQRTGIGIENLERWGYAASQSGADIDKLEVGMKKLSTSMVDAQDGSDKAKSAFETLGISMEDLSAMTPEDAFETVMNKLADMPESAEKNVVGNQLLGKSYTELKTLLSEGSDGMAALRDQADQLGIVMSEDSVVAAEGFGDQMDNVKLSLGAMKDKVMVELMPMLSDMLSWFIEKSPQIQEVAEKVFGAVGTAIGFITEHSNILLPMLGLVVGAFAAFKVISTVSGLMDTLKASTLLQTAAQGGLNAVMSANPFMIVVLAITALIVIGVLLYKNWDEIKAKAQEIWDKISEVFGAIGDKVGEVFGGIKDKATEVWGAVTDFISEKVTAIKDNVSEKFNAVKDAVSEKWGAVKDKTSEIWGNIKDTVGNAMENAKSNVQEKLNNMKDAFEENGGGIKGIASAAMEGVNGFFTDGFDALNTLTGGRLGDIADKFTEGFDKAKEIVSGAIKKIKGFLNFKWEFPKLKMPHFKISGSANPLKWPEEGVPKLSVDWYAKGGIFDKPTIFDTPYGLKGVGDASSPEVVAPLNDLGDIIREEMISVLKAILTSGARQQEQEITIEVPIYLDSEELARGIYPGIKAYGYRSRIELA